MAKIEVTSLQPRIANDEVIVVDIQTALFLDGEDGTRVPSISFEVKTAAGKATAISSENGFCEIKDLPIGLVLHEGSELPEYQDGSLSLVATYSEGGETKKVVQNVKVDIVRQIQELLGIKKAKQDREAEQRQRADDEAKRKSADEERLRIAHARYEALEPEKKRQIKGSITEAGRRIMGTERFEVDPFNVLREYGDHPHAKVSALAAAKVMPRRFIDGVGIYKSASWADEAMGIATKELPECAISLVENFEDMPWAIDILKIAAKRYAKEVIIAMSKYAGRPWCYELMMHLAELAPQAVFETAIMWEHYPWAREVALKAAAKAPEFITINYPLYQHQPWARELYEKATALDENGSAENAEFQRRLKKEIQNMVNAITNDNPRNNEHFAFLYEHRYHPQTRELMLDVCKRRRIACASAIGIYKSAPWAREVMIDIASDAIHGSEISMNVVENYIEMPWAGEVMRMAAAHQPKVAIHLLPKYAAKGWAKTVMLDIAKKFPAEILSEIEYIEFQPWAGEVAAEASKSVSYSEMSEVFKKCKFQSWMTPVIQGIKARELSEQQALAKAEKEKKAASERADFGKAEAARLASLRDKAWKNESEMSSRRSFLRKALGIGAALVGIAGVGGVIGLPKLNKEIVEIEMRKCRMNPEDFTEEPQKILPNDIRTWLIPENLRNLFNALKIEYIFEKKQDGSYEYDLPDISNILNPLVDRNYDDGAMYVKIKSNIFDIKRIGNGIITANLAGYRSRMEYGEHIEGFNERRSNVENWIIIEVDTEKMKNDGVLEGKITIKESYYWPIAETVKFKFKNDLWYMDHTAKVQHGPVSGPELKVVHSVEEKAQVREERRKRAVEKVLNAK